MNLIKLFETPGGRRRTVRSAFMLAILLSVSGQLAGQYITKYPDIPRIDVHAHIRDDYQSGYCTGILTWYWWLRTERGWFARMHSLIFSGTC
jgi:hypothetical protein